MLRTTPISDGLQEQKRSSSYPKYMDNYLKQVISEVKKTILVKISFQQA